MWTKAPTTGTPLQRDTSMTRTNLTIQLDDDVARRAKVLAARRGTSVSALVARTLDAMVDEDERYETARRRVAELMAQAGSHGPRTWTRDELHDR
jgi:predicted transcriptional regulator